MIAIGGYQFLMGDNPQSVEYQSIAEHQKVSLARLDEATTFNYNSNVPAELNFVASAAIATKAVVHISSKYEGATSYNGFFRYRSYPSSSKGSGVIVSDDGYIVTNNHVIDGSDEVEVTLYDNRRYKAKIIGTDPTTDLALLKINERNLNFLPYGNSDDLLIGQWVLAVGNPFELNSTVTAGIVSAKARNINILSDENRLQIESFIQTDAAVNPGNSGGALVDLSGKLVGINTAIATKTGTYSGYSFAVPVTLVQKVVDDLLEFGEVQRGLLGVSIIDAALVSQQQDLDVLNGVYINEVNENSAAQAAGMQRGDIIVGINDRQVLNTSELQELVARNRPGDKVKVTFFRNGKENSVFATLKSFEGSVEVVRSPSPSEAVFDGATFKDLSGREARRLSIRGGVQVTGITSGKWKEAGIEEGFVITEIDKSAVLNIEDMRRILTNKVGERIIILGVDPDGDRSYYSMRW